MHEEDFGILWKVRVACLRGGGFRRSGGQIELTGTSNTHSKRQHVDYRTAHSETRRSRRLVISFLTTVVNYEVCFTN